MPFKVPPLKATELRVKRQVGGRAGRIIEAIDHQEVDPVIAPVGRRRIWLGNGYSAGVDRNGNRFRGGGCGNGDKNSRITNRTRHD